MVSAKTEFFFWKFQVSVTQQKPTSDLQSKFKYLSTAKLNKKLKTLEKERRKVEDKWDEIDNVVDIITKIPGLVIATNELFKHHIKYVQLKDALCELWKNKCFELYSEICSIYNNTSGLHKNMLGKFL